MIFLTHLLRTPYDKTAMPVKRINAFRIGTPERGAALFDPYKTAPLPDVIASATTVGRH